MKNKPLKDQPTVSILGKVFAKLFNALDRITPIGYEDASGFHYGQETVRHKPHGRLSAANAVPSFRRQNRSKRKSPLVHRSTPPTWLDALMGAHAPSHHRKVVDAPSILLIAALAIGTTGLQAEESHPFQLSLTPDVAIYPKTSEIRGLSLNIWGENPQQGVAIGLVNGSTGDSAGFTWALYNYAESYTGVSWGLANYSKTSFVGWQGGVFFFPCLVNVSKGTFTGFQEAVVNYAEEFHGFQLGLVNYSDNLNGVQVGIVNIAMNNPWFNEFPDKLATGFPIVNWSF